MDCKTVRIFAYSSTYAQAVKQKVWNEDENGERDWGESKFATVPLLVFSVPFDKRTVLQTCRFLLILACFHRLLLLLCFIHTCHYCYILMVLFPTLNLKILKIDSGCPRSRELMFTFCWINIRPCKHRGTVPSLTKFLSFKYVRVSIHSRF